MGYNYGYGRETPFGNVHQIIVDGNTEQELRESFESALSLLSKPKLNKIQEWLYGDRLSSLPKDKLEQLLAKRCGSGKTTAHAMKQISESIQNPNKPVRLYNDEQDSPVANGLYARQVVLPMIENLDLKFMVYKQASNTLVFQI